MGSSSHGGARPAGDGTSDRLERVPEGHEVFRAEPGAVIDNYIVDDVDAILAKLAADGVALDTKREDHEYERLAWIFDPIARSNFGRSQAVEDRAPALPS